MGSCVGWIRTLSLLTSLATYHTSASDLVAERELRKGSQSEVNASASTQISKTCVMAAMFGVFQVFRSSRLWPAAPDPSLRALQALSQHAAAGACSPARAPAPPHGRPPRGAAGNEAARVGAASGRSCPSTERQGRARDTGRHRGPHQRLTKNNAVWTRPGAARKGVEVFF